MGISIYGIICRDGAAPRSCHYSLIMVTIRVVQFYQRRGSNKFTEVRGLGANFLTLQAVKITWFTDLVFDHPGRDNSGSRPVLYVPYFYSFTVLQSITSFVNVTCWRLQLTTDYTLRKVMYCERHLAYHCC